MNTQSHKNMNSCGGCVSKLPQGMLNDAVSHIPRYFNPNLLVGFDTSDDGAVYRLSGGLAIINTLDFFPPMVGDPYLFGKIAAANALSDIYAMGGEVISALNIVCFPEDGDPAVLGEILKGGAEKVHEAGGVICGGHSIADRETKYGLSVTGLVHPDRITPNNRCMLGDIIILTKALGVGLITSSFKLGEASEESYLEAVHSMEALNRSACEAAKGFRVNSCTDVTGFGFLGHLNEMVTPQYSIRVDAGTVPYFKEAERLASEFLVTGGGIKNRSYLRDKVVFHGVSMPIEEIFFDPQTSGGLLLSVHKEDAEALLSELKPRNPASRAVGEVVPRLSANVIVMGC